MVLRLETILHSANCTDGALRLVGGSTDREGQVEVCVGGRRWRTVCTGKQNWKEPFSITLLLATCIQSIESRIKKKVSVTLGVS